MSNEDLESSPTPKGNQYVSRPRRVYWIRRPSQSDILVFDGGYSGGDIHIYEQREILSTKEIEKEMQGRDLSPALLPERVRLWLEEKYGRLLFWDLKN